MLCIYSNLIRQCRLRDIQRSVDLGQTGELLHCWIEAGAAHRPHRNEGEACFSWFSTKRAKGLLSLPSGYNYYAYHDRAIQMLGHCFHSRFESAAVTPFTESEKSILSLYSILFREFNNLPSACNSEWISFGFCYCTNHEQQTALAVAYGKLALSGTPLDEIAHAWKTPSLANLMRDRGIEVTQLESNGIQFHRPPAEELGIYRLMMEV